MKPRLQLAHFTNAYYPVVSGVVRSVSTFRQALSELGHNVFIFAPHSNGYEETDPFVFRYPALNVPLMSGFPLIIPVSPFNNYLLPRLGLDVIHSHHPIFLGQTAVRKAAELDVPLVFTYHTRYQEYSHYVSLNQNFIKATISRWLGEYMQQCHHVIVPSESIRAMLAEKYGLVEQISVIPTGIDLRLYQQIDSRAIRQGRGWGNDTVLVSVGRLVKEKNWKMLLEAAGRVIRDRRNTRLVLIGEGEERAALERYAVDLEIREKVEFTGSVPFEDIPSYLSAADLFCFASTAETQGLVTMEAMAAGLPVVSVEAWGTRDLIVDGQEGFLTMNDCDAFARAIERMVNDKTLRARCREAAWQKAHRFEIKQQVPKLLTVYEQAIADKKAGRLVSLDNKKAAKPTRRLRTEGNLG